MTYMRTTVFFGMGAAAAMAMDEFTDPRTSVPGFDAARVGMSQTGNMELGIGNGEDPVAALVLHGGRLPAIEVTGQSRIPGIGGIDPEGPALLRRVRAVGTVKLGVFKQVHGKISLYVIITAPYPRA